MQKFFKQAFASVKVFRVFVLSLRLMTDENAMNLEGDSWDNLIEDFLMLVKRFTLLVRSLVPT